MSSNIFLIVVILLLAWGVTHPYKTGSKDDTIVSHNNPRTITAYLRAVLRSTKLMKEYRMDKPNQSGKRALAINHFKNPLQCKPKIHKEGQR